MSVEKNVGWATKMKSLLALQASNDTDSSGSISPPSSDESGEDEDDSVIHDADKEFESIFPKSLVVKEVLQAKVEQIGLFL